MPVRQLGDRGLGIGGRLHQAHQVGQPGVARGRAYPHHEGRNQVDGASGHLAAGGLAHRAAFTADQRFIRQARAGHHHAVSRHRVAGGNQDDVARRENARVHFNGGWRLRPTRDQRGLRRLHARKLLDGGAGAFARDPLKIASPEQKEHEHRDRVEVDRAGVEEGVPGTGGEGDQKPQRGRDVHADAAVREGAQGPRDQRRRRIEDHRHGKNETGDAQEFLDVRLHLAVDGKVGRRRVHHHLHHRKAGDEQAPQGHAALARPQRRGADGAHWPCAIAGAGDRRRDVRQGRARGIPANPRPMRCQTDVDGGHTGNVAHLHFDQLHATGAVDALDRENRLGKGGRRCNARGAHGLTFRHRRQHSPRVRDSGRQIRHR